MKHSCLVVALLLSFTATAWAQTRAKPAHMETPAPVPKLSLRDVRCLAHIIFGESRDEPEEGQFEVAWSMRFRQAANLREFGGRDLCRVAYKYARTKYGKVTWQYDGAKVSVAQRVRASKLESDAWDKSVYIAAMVLQGQGMPQKPIMYFCDRRSNGACSWHNRGARFTHRTGNHRMYTDKRFPDFSDLTVLASVR